MAGAAIAVGLAIGCAADPPQLPELTSLTGMGSDGATTSESAGTTTGVDGDGTSTGSGATGSDSGSDSGGGYDTTGGPSLPTECTESPSVCTTPPDRLPPGQDCDTFIQDCPNASNKCVPLEPYGYPGTYCMPLLNSPGQLGEECQLGHGGPIDSCDVGLICLGGSQTTAPSCHALCGCASAGPTCATDIFGSGLVCDLSADDLYGICRVPCNPLLSVCDVLLGDGGGCFPATGSDAFVCAQTNDPAATPGAPCQVGADCAPGQGCLQPGFGNCVNGERCCAELCDVTADGCSGGQTCNPWYASGPPPSGCEPNLGFCG
jgi:hypothetical protein